ncbi:MAG: biopolymer transporter ExbD [Chitinophagales bacterium]|nr:biopolymer transporter ExbD [Chitinophagales bacterium]
MKLKRRRAFHDEDAMSAMNDIMFFLMLFFLIISTMANQNIIKLLLPKAENSERIAKQPVSLTVTEDLTYYLNNTPINPDELESAIVNAVQNNSDPTVVLRVAKSLSVQDLVNIMQIGAKHKLKMVLSTEK